MGVSFSSRRRGADREPLRVEPQARSTGCRRGPGALEQGVDAHQHLAGPRTACHVVVAARVEPRDPVVHGVERGEEEHGACWPAARSAWQTSRPSASGSPMSITIASTLPGAENDAQRLVAVACDDHLVARCSGIREHAASRRRRPRRSRSVPWLDRASPTPALSGQGGTVRRRSGSRTWSGACQEPRGSLGHGDRCRCRGQPAPAGRPRACRPGGPPGQPAGRSGCRPPPWPWLARLPFLRGALAPRRGGLPPRGPAVARRVVPRSTAATGWTVPRCWSPSSGSRPSSAARCRSG